MSNLFSGKLIVIVGPSGVGKGTAINFLKKWHPEWVFPVSATTRSPRPGEIDGETYHFFSREQFQKMIAAGDFVEWARVHGDHFYGTLKSEIFPALKKGKIVLREVDFQGLLSIQKIVPKKNLITVFLLPPPREVLIKRIRARAPISDAELSERLKSLEKELPAAKKCDFQIQTRDGDAAFPAREIEKIEKNCSGVAKR